MRKKIILPACLIMAGGIGSRLGSITKKTPKPIIKINNKPYLEYILDWLITSGFKKFYFLLSYQNQKIKKVISNYFGERNLQYRILIDKKRSGTFSAITDHIHIIDNCFFYTNADELSKIDIKNCYSVFKKNKTKLMCGLLESKEGKFSLDKQNKIIKYASISDKKTYKDCGYKFIDKKIFKGIKKKYEKLEDFIYNDYLKNNKVKYFIVKNKPLRIDTALDIRRTNNELKKIK